MRTLAHAEFCWVMAHRWSFELCRCTFLLKFPELYVWVLAIIVEWLLCGHFLNRHIPVRSTFVPGQKTSCCPFFNKGLLCWNKNSVLCASAAEGSLSSDVKAYHDVTTVHKELYLMPCEVRPNSTLSSWVLHSLWDRSRVRGQAFV